MHISDVAKDLIFSKVMDKVKIGQKITIQARNLLEDKEKLPNALLDEL